MASSFMLGPFDETVAALGCEPGAGANGFLEPVGCETSGLVAGVEPGLWID